MKAHLKYPSRKSRKPAVSSAGKACVKTFRQNKSAGLRDPIALPYEGAFHWSPQAAPTIPISSGLRDEAASAITSTLVEVLNALLPGDGILVTNVDRSVINGAIYQTNHPDQIHTKSVGILAIQVTRN